MNRVFDVKFRDIKGSIVDCIEVNGEFPMRNEKLLKQELQNADVLFHMINKTHVSVLSLAETIVKCDKTDSELAVYGYICGHLLMKQGDSLKETLMDSIRECFAHTSVFHNNRPNSKVQLLMTLTKGLEKSVPQHFQNSTNITREEISHVITLIRLITLAGIGVIEGD